MRILALGDTHHPWVHKKALEWAYRLANKLKPTHIIQMGDLMDMFAFSRYPKILKMLPEKELELARTAAEKMWARAEAPNKIQLMGNHCLRPLARAISVAPELASLVGKSLRELYSFPGVRTVLDGREELILGGVAFQHGHRSRLGDHAKFNRISTCVGHSHTGGVVFLRDAKRTFWELNAGFLGDISSPAFGYTAQKRFHTTTLGVGVIDELGPRFIPYPGR